MATESGGLGDAAGQDIRVGDRGNGERRHGLAVFGIYLAIMGLGCAAFFGSDVLAAVGLAGTKGVMEVEQCVDSTVTEYGRGGGTSVHHCYGTFHPDHGEDVTGVELRGGRGDAYIWPRSCEIATVRPTWCPSERPVLRARLSDGRPWILGDGVLVPAGVSAMGLALAAQGVLMGAWGLRWPDRGSRPAWLHKAPKAVLAVGAAGFLVMLYGLVVYPT
ncbi:hypothetical protein [Kitasatospora camelliae]|uniref:Uncharacterized protein n=1 Tax=Kitasatospora camelliae TaxID=3156397 RepID=A0AAU8K826_9ACTN